jgi:hypothetical protein
MSILQSAVDKLFTEKNRVIFDPAGHRAVFEVTGLALFTFDDEPVQLAFCKNFDYPLEIGDDTMMDPESRDPQLLRTVKESDIARNYLRMRTVRESGSSTDHDYGSEDPAVLFSYLMGAARGGNVRMLEFIPTRPVYPCYYGYDKLRDAFDGITSFIDVNSGIHHPRMLLGLNWRGPEHRDRGRDTPTQLEFGNVLIWSGSDNCIHWVTRKKGVAVSLGSVGKVEDYSELLRFTRQFRPHGWEINTILPMPYHLPKVSPKEDKPEVDQAVFFLKVLETLVNKPVGQVDDASLSLLEAGYKKHLDPAPIDSMSKYLDILTAAIDEYMIICDGVGSKKRAEIKGGLIEHFIKRYRQVFPTVK